jgi:excinuclease UvrABC nuclease subunit
MKNDFFNRPFSKSACFSISVSKNRRKDAGIYFIFYNKNLMYIGMSEISVFKRLKDHAKENRIPFDSFDFAIFGQSMNLKALESDLIKKLNPPYNVRL